MTVVSLRLRKQQWANDHAGSPRRCRSLTNAAVKVFAPAWDDEGQRRPGLSDPRNAEVRPLAGGCRPTLSPAALPVAEQSSRVGAVTGVGVEQPREPEQPALLHSCVGGRQSRRSLPPWRRPPAYECSGDVPLVRLRCRTNLDQLFSRPVRSSAAKS